MSAAYGRVQVLFDVDIHADAGETVALLGVNGAGKSTLLKTISGLLRPTSGSVVLDGEDITGSAPHAIARRGLQHLPGGRGTFPELSVDEHFRLSAAAGRVADWQIRVSEIYETFEWMRERRSTPAGALSGGEQQILMLARALLVSVRVLLIDELSLGLAPMVIKRLLKMMDALRAEGTTIVLVEQHIDLALDLAQRAYFLEKGEVRYAGPAAELRDRPDLLRSVFLAGARAGFAKG